MKQSPKEFLKFSAVSAGVTLLQLITVNLLFYLMRHWQTPIPAVLTPIFNENTIGSDHLYLGYILPFFLANLTANTAGYFVNKKYTFKAEPPKKNFIIYLGVIVFFLFFSTWAQGVLVNLIQRYLPEYSVTAPSAASWRWICGDSISRPWVSTPARLPVAKVGLMQRRWQ